MCTAGGKDIFGDVGQNITIDFQLCFKCTSKTLELTKAFQLLVKNTISFLNEVGVVFEEADTNAACRVDVITK